MLRLRVPRAAWLDRKLEVVSQEDAAMFALKKPFGRPRSASVEIPSRRRRAFRGDLEQLEGKQLLTTVYPYEVAAGAVGANTSFVLEPGGNLYEHIGTNYSTGWTFLSGGVGQISAGRDSYGQNSVYALHTNGYLYEITSRGSYYLTSGVSQISASQFQSNTVFAIMNNGGLYEINGTGGTPLRYLGGGVSQISAGRDSSGNASVFVLFNNNVFEEDTSTGWHSIDSGGLMGTAVQIAASQFQANTAFVRNSAGGVLEYAPNGSLTIFRYLKYSGASEIAAGRDPSGAASVYFLSSGSLYELTSAGGPYFVAANVAILDPESAAQYQTDTIYSYGALRNSRTNLTTVTLDEFTGNGSRPGYDVGYYVTSFITA
jgi:hypothetical protein